MLIFTAMRGITLRAGTAPRPGPHRRPRDTPIVRAVAESVYVEIGGGRPITKSELCAGSGFCTSEGAVDAAAAFSFELGAYCALGLLVGLVPEGPLRIVGPVSRSRSPVSSAIGRFAAACG